jgi:hypothetical protein
VSEYMGSFPVDETDERILVFDMEKYSAERVGEMGKFTSIWFKTSDDLRAFCRDIGTLS